MPGLSEEAADEDAPVGIKTPRLPPRRLGDFAHHAATPLQRLGAGARRFAPEWVHDLGKGIGMLTDEEGGDQVLS
eukprot:3754138-Alexandrium_andersonii.AAC.1